MAATAAQIDSHLAAYLRKCTLRELSNEETLAKITFAVRSNMVQNATPVMRKLYQSDIEYAEARLVAIREEMQFRVIV